MNGGWTTKMSPTMIKKERKMERKVRVLLRKTLSAKMLKTGCTTPLV